MAEGRIDLRGRGLSVEQVRRNFDTSLARALEGLAPASHTGLGPRVENALIAIVSAYPAASDELIVKARQEFARELTILSTETDSDRLSEG